jgi:hypothetical protein
MVEHQSTAGGPLSRTVDSDCYAEDAKTAIRAEARVTNPRFFRPLTVGTLEKLLLRPSASRCESQDFREGPGVQRVKNSEGYDGQPSLPT